MSNNSSSPELSLDPQNWNEVRSLSHKMVDDVLDYLQNIKNESCWKPIPPEVKVSYLSPLPKTGESISEIYDQFLKNIFPYPAGNIHPRFWAWVQGTGTPLGVMADMLASAMNSNVTIADHSAMYIDNQVIGWCKEMMGFPEAASGMLVSGGSMANITGLIVARNKHSDFRVRNTGLKAMEKQLTIYCSAETHSCVMKGVEMIGIGHDYIRKINVNEKYEINIEELQRTIIHDLESGFDPFCVVANVGTVNTGATDDLSAIRKICDQYQLWMHIDGAFGALAKLTDEYKESLQTIELADSIAFDLHKWMYMPYEVGCILINDRATHRKAFNLSPNYLLSHERGLASGPDPFNNYGMELSRGFKALKVWMSIKEHGINKYADMIYQNILQARYLEQLVKEAKHLELCAPVTLNIVCYRFFHKDLDNNQLNQLNKEILMTIHERGIASPSSTLLNGVYAIRVANVNHRSTRYDFEVLVKETIKIGLEKLPS